MLLCLCSLVALISDRENSWELSVPPGTHNCSGRRKGYSSPKLETRSPPGCRMGHTLITRLLDSSAPSLRQPHQRPRMPRAHASEAPGSCNE